MVSIPVQVILFVYLNIGDHLIVTFFVQTGLSRSCLEIIAG